MLVGKIVKEIIKFRGHSYLSLAKKLGHEHASAVSNRLTDKSPIQINVLLRMIDALDCELVIRSKTKDKTEWIVSGTESEK